MRIIRVVGFVWALAATSTGEAQRMQSRTILHPTFDLDKNWYGTAWLTGNALQKAPDNFNVLPGFGYRSKGVWVEALAWRRWSKSGSGWGADIRLGAIRGKVSMYAELGIIPPKNGQVYVLSTDYSLDKKWKIGVETENFRRRQGWSLGAGPRVSHTWGTLGGGPVVTTLAYQLREESDILRLYLAIHPRF